MDSNFYFAAVRAAIRYIRASFVQFYCYLGILILREKGLPPFLSRAKLTFPSIDLYSREMFSRANTLNCHGSYF